MTSNEKNIENWKNIYEETSFGNKWPSSYLVSLYHREIEDLFSDITTPKVLG